MPPIQPTSKNGKHPAIIILAVGIDWLFGELPNALHPVAWFGQFVQLLVNRAPRDNPRAELLYGAGIAASGVTLAAAAGIFLERIFKSSIRNRFSVLAFAAVLKTTFAWRALRPARSRQPRYSTTRAAAPRCRRHRIIGRECE